jgi:hypothetical protein
VKIILSAILLVVSMAAYSKNQSEFIETTCDMKTDYSSAMNELQKALIRNKRKQFYSMFFKKDLRVNSWVGNITALDLVGDGKVFLSIRLRCGIELKTWNNELSDSTTGTLIDLYDQLGEKLVSYEVGQRVTFSGTFVKGVDDFIEEQSITSDGSMSNPEFTFIFSEIEGANR